MTEALSNLADTPDEVPDRGQTLSFDIWTKKPDEIPVKRGPSLLYQHLEAAYGPLDTDDPNEQPRIAEVTHGFLADRIRSVHAQRAEIYANLAHSGQAEGMPKPPEYAPVIPTALVTKSLTEYYIEIPANNPRSNSPQAVQPNSATIRRQNHFLNTNTPIAQDFEKRFPEIPLAKKLKDELTAEESIVAAGAVRVLIAGYGRALGQLNRTDTARHYGF